jgi:hypothetical protein
MAAFLDILKAATGIGGGALTAADDKKSLPDRIMGGVGSVGTALSTVGPWLGGLASSQLSGMGIGAIGATVADAGATVGAGAAAGTAASATGAVLGAGALGYGAGRLLDNGVGAASKALGGDGRTLSDRMGDGMMNTLGAKPGLWLADHLPTWLGGDGPTVNGSG